MDEKKTTRLRRLETVWVAAALLALLIAVGGEAYNWLDSFSGELCVGVSRAEHTAVRLAAAGASSSLKVELRARLRMMDGSVQHDLLPDEISFQDRETSPKLLNPQQRYDAVQLPFSMRLKRVALGPLRMAELPLGHVRALDRGEVRKLKQAAQETHAKSPRPASRPAVKKMARPKAPLAGAVIGGDAAENCREHALAARGAVRLNLIEPLRQVLEGLWPRHVVH